MIKNLLSVLLLLSTSLPFYAETQQIKPFGISLSVSVITLSGEDLTRAGYDFFDKDNLKNVPVIPIFIPALSACYKNYLPLGKLPAAIRYSADYTISPLSMGINSSVSLSFLSCVSVTVGGILQSSWNYGSELTLISTYDSQKEKYVSRTSLSELEYGINGSVNVIIPIGMYLSTLNYYSEYTGFTGTDNGQPWNCGMSFNNVNGWKYRATAMFGRRFTGKTLKMISISGSAGGWYSDSYFDDEYKDYDPTFVTFSIAPLVQLQLSDQQSLTISAVIDREREFDSDDYDSDDMILQNCTGGKWQFRTLMFLWHIKLY
jgi:hypothetical protein